MIRLTDIEKRFGDLTVLQGVSLTVAEGSVTALIGPSGGGKSTLLRCINLLEIPASGTVQVGDATLTLRPGGRPDRAAVQAVRRQTGMVFQNFQLFPHRTAIENVMEGLVTVLKWPAGKARAQGNSIHAFLTVRIAVCGFAANSSRAGLGFRPDFRMMLSAQFRI